MGVRLLEREVLNKPIWEVMSAVKTEYCCSYPSNSEAILVLDVFIRNKLGHPPSLRHSAADCRNDNLPLTSSIAIFSLSSVAKSTSR